MLDSSKIQQFISSFNLRYSDDWNPYNLNLKRMLTEFFFYCLNFLEQQENKPIHEYEAGWSDGFYITRNGKSFITFSDTVSNEEVLDVVQALNAAQKTKNIGGEVSSFREIFDSEVLSSLKIE